MDDLDESDGGGGVRGRMRGIFTTRNTPFRSKISCLGVASEFALLSWEFRLAGC